MVNTRCLNSILIRSFLTQPCSKVNGSFWFPIIKQPSIGTRYLFNGVCRIVIWKGLPLCHHAQSPVPQLQWRSSKVLEKRSLWSLLKVGNLYQASTTLGLEPVSIVHYTRPGSSIKRPTPNYLATQRHVNWPVVYPKSSYKIMDPVSAALPQNLRRIFVATLLCNTTPNNAIKEIERL